VAQSRKLPLKRDWLQDEISRFAGDLYWGPVDLLQTLLERGGDRTGNSLFERFHEIFEVAFEKCKTMCEGYREVLEIFGVESSWRDESRLFWKMLSFALLGRLEKYLKFETAFLLARALRNEPPELPKGYPWTQSPGHLFMGGVQRKVWLRCVLRAKPKDVQLAYSLYQAKRIAPSVDPEFVQEALDDHKTAICAERESRPVGYLEEEVRRTVREVVTEAERRGWKPHHGGRIPTFSASFERSRLDGGAYAEIVDPDPLICLGFPLLVGYVRFKTRVRPVYVKSDPEEVRRKLSPSRDGLGGPVKVRREPVLEPFKVRVVSMGESRPYQIARNHQRALWETMQYIPSLSLTGKPVEAEDVAEICWLPRVTRVHSVMVSGDYTAATDNLHPELCAGALDEYCRLAGVSLGDRLVLQSCLTGHSLDGERQTWGQLMGSPISFPILCLVNIAVTRFVQEREYGRRLDLVDCPLKVNGDDILFCLPPAGYYRWGLEVSKAGLVPSVGKNYVSRQWAVLNSDLFELPKDWDRDSLDLPVRRPCVKLNLLWGEQHHTTERRSGVSLFHGEVLAHGKTYRGRLLELIKGWNPEVADELVSRAVRYQRSLLDRLPPVSWWIAEDKGGLGLPMPIFKPSALRPHHLRLAAWMDCLDPEARRERVRMSWLRQPGQFFTELALAASARLRDELGVPWIQCPRDERPDDDGLDTRMLRGYLEVGQDRELCDDRLFLQEWFHSYWRWIALSRKTFGALHAMGGEKAIEPAAWVWSRPAVVWE
jgi:hypothetical protein